MPDRKTTASLLANGHRWISSSKESSSTVKLIICLHLLPKSKMHGLLPPYTLHTFRHGKNLSSNINKSLLLIGLYVWWFIVVMLITISSRKNLWCLISFKCFTLYEARRNSKLIIMHFSDQFLRRVFTSTDFGHIKSADTLKVWFTYHAIVLHSLKAESAHFSKIYNHIKLQNPTST